MKPDARLATFLPYQLSLTSNAVSGRIAQEYRARFGLSVPEWRVMAVLGDAGSLTQRDLTERTLMDKVAVNRACKGLEDHGLAARQPNEKDGRSHLLALTSKGVAVHGQIMPLATELERRLFGAFGPHELDTLKSMLERIRNEVIDFDAETLSDDFGME